MASRSVDLIQNTWTPITGGDLSGCIYHKRGSTRILYVQAVDAPVGFDADTPVCGSTVRNENLHFDVPAGEFIFAYTTLENLSVTVTPVGV